MSFCQSIEYRPNDAHYRPTDIFLQRQIVAGNYQNSDMQTLSERLKIARKNAQLSQVALAKKTGLAQSTISGIETGDQSATTFVPQLAAALGVNALWLAEGKGPRDATSAEPQPKLEKFVVSPDLLWKVFQAIDAHLEADESEMEEEARVKLAAMVYSGFHKQQDVSVEDVTSWLDQWWGLIDSGRVG